MNFEEFREKLMEDLADTLNDKSGKNFTIESSSVSNKPKKRQYT